MSSSEKSILKRKGQAARASYPEKLDHPTLLGALEIPVLSGLTVSHTNDQLTLSLGVTATLDAVAGTLDLKEAAVV